MAIRVQRHANVSKQATLLDGLGVSPLKWRVCGCGFNRFVHEGMNHISNVEVHLKTRSGNVNILRKTIEGYSDSVPSLTSNTIKTLLIIHAFHSSRLLHAKWVLYFSHASMV